MFLNAISYVVALSTKVSTVATIQSSIGLVKLNLKFECEHCKTPMVF